MHDGRFSNLEEVLKFKVQGIQDSPTLDPYLKKGIKLNTQEQKAIISFLNTLTDFNFIGNSLFSEPVR
jgi:cytochrome c peroxidase